MNKNKRLALNLVMVALGMGMMAYAAVPLYKLFCQQTGFGGTPMINMAYEGEISERVVTIRFNADADSRLGWDFKPEQQHMKVHLGENSLAFYKAINKSGVKNTGTAVYNVAPEKAGRYFNKVECFCFTKQPLENGKEAHFPVSFFVDPEFAKDPYMDDVDTITLSYTFYESDEEGNAIQTPKK